MVHKQWLMFGVVVMVVLTQEARGSAVPRDEGESHRFTVTYDESKVTQNRSWYVSNHVLEPVVDGLNSVLKPSSLPVQVQVVATDCGKINAFYDPNDHHIRICYELLDELARISSGGSRRGDYSPRVKDTSVEAERTALILGAARFILLHEIGHAFQDLLKRGGTGNQESEADSFAAILAITLGHDGAQMAVYGAYFFSQLSDKERLDFNDEHPPSLERTYDITCLVYGSDPTYYPTLGKVLGERAGRCQRSYETTKDAWRRQLRKFLVDAETDR